VQIKVTLDPSITGSSGAPTLSTSIPSCIIAFNFDKFYTRVMSLFLLPGTIKENQSTSIALFRSTGKILRLMSSLSVMSC
jgi:hypothetical protein